MAGDFSSDYLVFHVHQLNNDQNSNALSSAARQHGPRGIGDGPMDGKLELLRFQTMQCNHIRPDSSRMMFD